MRYAEKLSPSPSYTTKPRQIYHIHGALPMVFSLIPRRFTDTAKLLWYLNIDKNGSFDESVLCFVKSHYPQLEIIHISGIHNAHRKVIVEIPGATTGAKSRKSQKQELPQDFPPWLRTRRKQRKVAGLPLPCRTYKTLNDVVLRGFILSKDKN